MTLPKDFESVIEEEYSNYGWELAYCFSFIAKYLGYRVLDLSSVETALKMVATLLCTSLKNYDDHYPIDFQDFIHEYYLEVHEVFTRRAKNIKLQNEDDEVERQQKIIEEFKNYIMPNKSLLYRTKVFYSQFLPDILDSAIQNIFEDIEEVIEDKMSEDKVNENKES